MARTERFASWILVEKIRGIGIFQISALGQRGSKQDDAGEKSKVRLHGVMSWSFQ
jgi:hypothetical protein